MSSLAIRVAGLGKQYRLGRSVARYRTLRDALTGAAAAPYRWLRAAGGGEPERDFWAIKDVSFDVAPGEVVGIIGRNGAGKSTLLKVLSRITEPTEGEADIHGRVGSLLEVGTGFHPELTGRENIYLNGAILGMTRKEVVRKFDEIVAFAEVERFIDTAVKFYSSGMYTRLAFAVAAQLEPEILIVDEVLAVGDSAFQQRCLGKMGEVARCGRTVLFVSHNMSAIQQLCKSAILLRAGRVHSVGEVGPTVLQYLGDAIDGEDGHFDVTDHPARQKQYAPVIRRITLCAGDGRPRSTFHPQDSLVVALGISLPRRVREPRVAIAIEDGYGRRLGTAANYFGGTELADLEGEVTVRCTVPRLGLGTGRYLISASIGEKNHALLDSLDGVGWFTVEWDNNYGTGESFLPVYGPLLIESNWELCPVSLEEGNA